jgi:FkbM family methyltransferase
MLLWPVVLYLKSFPIQRGKGIVLRNVLLPLLPPVPETFETSVPGGARLRLQFREVVGLSTLMGGGFETAEIEYVRAHLKPSDTFIDVGANAGLYTMAMAGVVGRVMAYEPLPENFERLRANIKLNNFSNVESFLMALGDHDGKAELKSANDPGYHSIVAVSEQRADGGSLTVPIARMDTVWHEAGSPFVSAIKIDVEGAELLVLKGAETVLSACRPLFLIEANTRDHLNRLKAWLEPRGYRYHQPAGFKAWNYAFVPIRS